MYLWHWFCIILNYVESLILHGFRIIRQTLVIILTNFPVFHHGPGKCLIVHSIPWYFPFWIFPFYTRSPLLEKHTRNLDKAILIDKGNPTNINKNVKTTWKHGTNLLVVFWSMRFVHKVKKTSTNERLNDGMTMTLIYRYRNVTYML